MAKPFSGVISASVSGAAALIGAAAMILPLPASAELRALMDEPDLQAIAQELSGETAKRNLDTVTLYHRTRASRQFRQAAEHIRDQLRSYGIDNARILEFPADGKTMFGTQKSRPAWDVNFAELWELRKNQEGEWVRAKKLGDWDAIPLTLAQDSLSGEATAGLVDIGAGTKPSDFEGKDVSGRFVLTSSQPGAVADLAVGEYGAAGIISYAPNQRTAWWKEDDRLVRWGHLSSFPDVETFAFMISLGEARRLQQSLQAGEELRFHGKVDAGHDRRGKYSFVTASIPGADRALRKQEIIFTCHLDHPRPGANDNASGCVAILEAARTAQKLIDEGRIKRPKRTLRFLWPAEIEGSLIYLNAMPDAAKRIKANIHLDMVGGDQNTKAVFRVSGGPESLPHFISDLGHEVGAFVNAQSDIHAGGGDTPFPLTAPEGGKESFLALMQGIDLGSDHQIFNEGSWRIPGIYLHDWPDRYIHTNFDSAANIDPTKLKRAAFIGLTTALYLADMDAGDASPMLSLLRRNALARARTLEERLTKANPADANAIRRVHWLREHAKIDSITDFAELADDDRAAAHEFIDALAALTGGGAQPSGNTNGVVYERNPNIKGPMSAFGYSYLADHLGDEAQSLALPGYAAYDGDGRMIGGGVFTYEALNLVDGKRSAGDIRAWLTATLAPVPRAAVEDYLAALEQIGVLQVKE
jgi:aminopeptidase YwaD